MARNILLIEPNYKNKYPPIGLMKLSTYHKQLGDNVRFFKGDLYEFIASEITEMAINKFASIDTTVSWQKHYKIIFGYIKTGKNSFLTELCQTSCSPILKEWFAYYRNYYKNGEYKKNPQWDRICITTLFTFYWKETVETIQIAKTLVKNIDQLFVGGILATVLHDELEQEAKVSAYKGLLNCPGILDDNDTIIDTLPLDYSILFEIKYKYPADNAFYAWTTRGCPNKCTFCAVPILEPGKFNHYIPITNSIEHIKKIYGDKPDLLIMDNNVLKSNNFKKIITDIKECGFEKGSMFMEPDYLEIYINNLKNNINNHAFMSAIFEQYKILLDKSNENDRQFIYNTLHDLDLLDIHTTTKKALLEAYPLLKDYNKEMLSKSSRQRTVDFNQGLDASFLTDEKAKLLSEIAIKPLRIAFDFLQEKDVYIDAVSLCEKHGIKSFSNYLLYNYNDTPEELYTRLKINIKLCGNLKINIYSFPMKYHPISGEYSKNRNFIGPHWNRKYIRAVQTILNATKGKIGRGKSFFNKAFGKSVEEYKKLILMPETYLLYRFFFEDIGRTQEWENSLMELNVSEKHELIKLIEDNIINQEIYSSIENKKIREVYGHYLIKRGDVLDKNTEIGKLKKEYDKKSCKAEGSL